MRALAKWNGVEFEGYVTLHDKPLPPPEPAFAASRPALGLFALLSSEQQEMVRTYTGDETVCPASTP